MDSISCTSWGGDYLLFAPDGSLVTPAFLFRDQRLEAGRKQVLSTISPEALYEETGYHPSQASTLFQLAVENPKRLKHAGLVMPIADGFNYLLSDVARAEMSLASTTHLCNPATRSWSGHLLNPLHLPSSVLPQLVPAATELGPLRADIAEETHIEDAKVIASCSHGIAAAVAGLPIAQEEGWAFLLPGKATLLGTQVGAPLLTPAARRMGFSNEIACGGGFYLHKQTIGLSILDECERFWKQTDREIDLDLLSHLAGSVAPFESLIDPADPRFSTPGDMPLKIQAFCKETGQAVPRRPGAIFRCILESLALLYRKSMHELELLTGTRFARLFILGETEHSLLNHFTANALGIPSVVVGADSVATGNIALQMLALGHVKSLGAARDLTRNSFKRETIIPYASAWDAAFDRLVTLSAERSALASQ